MVNCIHKRKVSGLELTEHQRPTDYDVQFTHVRTPLEKNADCVFKMVWLEEYYFQNQSPRVLH